MCGQRKAVSEPKVFAAFKAGDTVRITTQGGWQNHDAIHFYDKGTVVQVEEVTVNDAGKLRYVVRGAGFMQVVKAKDVEAL